MNHVNLIGKVHTSPVLLSGSPNLIATFKVTVKDVSLNTMGDIVTKKDNFPIYITGRWLDITDLISPNIDIALEGKLIIEQDNIIILADDIILL